MQQHAFKRIIPHHRMRTVLMKPGAACTTWTLNGASSNLWGACVVDGWIDAQREWHWTPPSMVVATTTLLASHPFFTSTPKKAPKPPNTHAP